MVAIARCLVQSITCSTEPQHLLKRLAFNIGITDESETGEVNNNVEAFFLYVGQGTVCQHIFITRSRQPVLEHGPQ